MSPHASCAMSAVRPQAHLNRMPPQEHDRQAMVSRGADVLVTDSELEAQPWTTLPRRRRFRGLHVALSPSRSSARTQPNSWELTRFSRSSRPERASMSKNDVMPNFALVENVLDTNGTSKSQTILPSDVTMPAYPEERLITGDDPSLHNDFETSCRRLDELNVKISHIDLSCVTDNEQAKPILVKYNLHLEKSIDLDTSSSSRREAEVSIFSPLSEIHHPEESKEETEKGCFSVDEEYFTTMLRSKEEEQSRRPPTSNAPRLETVTGSQLQVNDADALRAELEEHLRDSPSGFKKSKSCNDNARPDGAHMMGVKQPMKIMGALKSRWATPFRLSRAEEL